jgi:hypothetical protein
MDLQMIANSIANGIVCGAEEVHMGKELFWGECVWNGKARL